MKKDKASTELLKQNILKTSYDVFSEKGYTATNLQDIADRLEISRNPIYYHYKNKQQLYRATADFFLNWKLNQYQTIWTKDGDYFEIVKEDLMFCTSIAMKESVFLLASQTNLEFQDVNKIWKNTFQQTYQLKLNVTSDFMQRKVLRSDASPKEIVYNLYILYYGFKGILSESPLLFSADDQEHLIDSLIQNMITQYKIKN